MATEPGGLNQARAFLTSFARDVRGNTVAIMAAALIPLAGMVGGGVDLSRMYIVKTRLQHACDAGALAGRKVMGGGTWAATGAQAEANRFFDANYNKNAYGLDPNTVTKSFVESAGKVTGTASAQVPMTLMRIFRHPTETLTVTCDAEMRLPNTDVMFVLDVTQSMAQKAVSTDSQTKIVALRSAVKCFYEIVARRDTDENCVGGAPSGGVGGTVQVRFGFVPYDMEVNVGRLLPSNWFASQWPYQSRERTTAYGTFSSWETSGTNTRNDGNWSGWTTDRSQTVNNSTACTNAYTIPGDSYTINGAPTSWPDNESANSWRAWAPYTQRNWQRSYNSTTKLCALQYRERYQERRAWWNRAASSSTSGAVAFPAWSYRQVELNIAGLKNGTGWNSAVTLPIGNNHTDVSVTWDGCIEERGTVRATSYTTIPAGAYDLDIDSAPSGTGTFWGPALRNVIYPRKNSYSNSGSYTTNTMTTFNQDYTGEAYSCPTEAKKLQEWDDPDVFDTYVNNMWGGGNTYHDIGLIWGGRLMSPTGLFRTENEFTHEGGEIERHMIFMTDGDACTSGMNYTAYGLAWYDRRQTNINTDPGTSMTCSSDEDGGGILTTQVELRTPALCTAIKNKGITLWVIYFGTPATADIRTAMSDCASTGRFFEASNATLLQQQFRSIADQISQLRLTR